MNKHEHEKRSSGKKLFIVSVAAVLLVPKVMAELSYLTLVNNWGNTNTQLGALKTLEKLPFYGRAPLLRLLNDENVGARSEAAESLRYHRGQAVVDALIEAARTDKSSVRMQALRSLGRIGDLRAIPAMEEMARTSTYAHEPLLWMGAEGRDALLRVVDVAEAPPYQRQHALERLCEGAGADDEATRTRAVRSFQSGFPELRIAALSCIGVTGPEGVEAAILALSDEVFEVRIRAASALRTAGRTDGLAVLKGLLLDTTAPEGARASAAWELGQFKQDELLPLLRRIASGDSSELVRERAKAAIRQIQW